MDVVARGKDSVHDSANAHGHGGPGQGSNSDPLICDLDGQSFQLERDLR